jgi:hypothetical protein
VADSLAAAAKIAIAWAEANGIAFDQGKTEAALFRRKGPPSATIKVGNKDVTFNREATRWLGVWLDSQLTLKEHHAIGLKEGKKAMGRLRRLTGQMGLSPANCRKVMTAYIQSVAMFGSELWWKGDGVVGTMGRAEELQKLVNQQAQGGHGLLPSNQPGGTGDGVRTQTGNSSAGEPPTMVRITATQPAPGRSDQRGGGSSILDWKEAE